MVRLVSGLLVVLACFFYSPSKADETGNILDNSNWTGNVTPCSGSSCWGGYWGGQTPSWNGSIFRWGYGGGSVHQQIALNQVFSDMGINLLGYRYSWDVKNWNSNGQFGSPQDPFNISIKLYADDGSLLEVFNYDYSYPIPSHTNFSGTQYFANEYWLGDLSNIQISATGRDAGYWAGWYGPEWTPRSLSLLYEVDACIANPLSDTSCPGYAEAYYDQQCSYDPLYDSGCPGYEQAYYNQQCSFDALYDTGCPGYEEAYYNQQCSFDALYDIGCPGYAEAYYVYQCSLDALYDQGCDGYAIAFEKQQCSLDPQYSPTCPGYEFPTTQTVEEEIVVVVVEEEPVQQLDEQQAVTEVIEEDYVEVIEPLTKEKEKEDGESKSSDSTTNESDNKPESRKRESALRVGLGVSDRLVAGLVQSSISSGDASAEESQAMNQMIQADSEAFSQLTQSTSTSTTDENNSVAGVGPVVVVIIPPESSGGEPTEKQQSLAERIAEQVRKANLEKSATYKGQTAMLENINNAVSLASYDTALNDRDEIYVMSQIYPGNILKTNNADHYRMRRQDYGVMQQMIRSQY